MKNFVRKEELDSLRKFADSEHSEFLYVRGRRRIGKSWLLMDFARRTPAVFLYAAAKDSSEAHALKGFSQRWAEFSGSATLLELKPAVLSWHRIFREITNYAEKAKSSFIIVIDEVQWLAKSRSGFIGALKEAWVSWQRSNRVKIIICGSSNKFFKEKTGGEEKILRGLQTRADLWIQPLSPSQVRSHCLVNWSPAETILLYMMIGGIPYYLERIDAQKGFIHAINDAFFLKDENLLKEIDELLNLEFNEAGQETVKSILAALGQAGTTQVQVQKKTGLHKSTVQRTLEKLVQYDLVFRKISCISNQNRKTPEIDRGTRYYMKDFFLNFYFQILAPLAFRIHTNTAGLLFPYETGLSRSGYYIPNFSGQGFELVVRYMFERGFPLPDRVAEKMLLKDGNYELLDYWDEHTQIDLIVRHRVDRIIRVIECKWGDLQTSWIDEVCAKPFQPPPGDRRLNVLCVSADIPANFEKNAREKNVVTIGLGEWF